MEFIVIFIYIHFFFGNVYVYTRRKTNPIHVRIKKTKYWELSWAIKMEFGIIEKSQYFNSQKTVSKFTKETFKTFFFVNDTIQWLSCVVHYLNVKIN